MLVDTSEEPKASPQGENKTKITPQRISLPTPQTLKRPSAPDPIDKELKKARIPLRFDIIEDDEVGEERSKFFQTPKHRQSRRPLSPTSRTPRSTPREQRIGKENISPSSPTAGKSSGQLAPSSKEVPNTQSPLAPSSQAPKTTPDPVPSSLIPKPQHKLAPSPRAQKLQPQLISNQHKQQSAGAQAGTDIVEDDDEDDVDYAALKVAQGWKKKYGYTTQENSDRLAISMGKENNVPRSPFTPLPRIGRSLLQPRSFPKPVMPKVLKVARRPTSTPRTAPSQRSNQSIQSTQSSDDEEWPEFVGVKERIGFERFMHK